MASTPLSLAREFLVDLASAPLDWSLLQPLPTHGTVGDIDVIVGGSLAETVNVLCQAEGMRFSLICFKCYDRNAAATYWVPRTDLDKSEGPVGWIQLDIQAQPASQGWLGLVAEPMLRPVELQVRELDRLIYQALKAYRKGKLRKYLALRKDIDAIGREFFLERADLICTSSARTRLRWLLAPRFLAIARIPMGPLEYRTRQIARYLSRLTGPEANVHPAREQGTADDDDLVSLFDESPVLVHHRSVSKRIDLMLSRARGIPVLEVTRVDAPKEDASPLRQMSKETRVWWAEMFRMSRRIA